MNESAIKLTHVLLLITFPFLVGTTYIIKEGNREVGRVEEKDGREAIEFVEYEGRSLPEPPPQPQKETIELKPESPKAEISNEIIKLFKGNWAGMTITLVSVFAGLILVMLRISARKKMEELPPKDDLLPPSKEV